MKMKFKKKERKKTVYSPETELFPILSGLFLRAELTHCSECPTQTRQTMALHPLK